MQLILNGQTIECNSTSGIVYKNEPKSDDEETIIKPFDKTDVDDKTTIDDIVKPNISGDQTDKELEYDVKDSSILQISSDGQVTVLSDGTTEVGVKLDGEEIGKLNVETEDGKIKSVSSSDDENDVTTDDENTKEKKKSVTESGKNISPFLLFFILLIIIIIIYITYKNKNDKGKRELEKYRKNRRKKYRKSKRKEENKNEKIS